jgi:hypothetical protein
MQHGAQLLITQILALQSLSTPTLAELQLVPISLQHI